MIKIVEKLLEVNNYSDVKNEFEDLFLSHPNYPSLFAITDSLDLLSIENVAANVPKNQLLDLPESFLAFFKGSLVFVLKNEKEIKVDNCEGIKQTISFDAFASDWNGIIVAIESNEKIITHNEKFNLIGLKSGLPLLFLIVLSVFLNHYELFSFIFLGISIIGLVISVFIVQEKFGIKNQLVSKFCNISPNVSCDSVINSEKKNGIEWVNFSELPLLFFSTSVLSIIFQPSESSALIGFLSLLSLPLLLFSIWIQKFQIKKWCVLCLIVSFLIMTQALIWFFMKSFSLSFSFSSFLIFGLALALIYSIWILIKPFINDSINAKRDLKQIKKFKRNFSLLTFLSKDIPEFEGFDKLSGLSFGNENASLNLSIIISPSCGHCHKAFKESFELVSKFPDKVFLRVLFNINPENNDNPYKIVVERLLEINYTNPKKIEAAISDWHIKKMTLEAWKIKWEVNSISMTTNQQIQQQYEWCSKNEFNYTPVKIINNKQFPNEYDISELKYFLNDFVEETQVLREKIA